MWYRQARMQMNTQRRKVTAQALNVGPVAPPDLPEEDEELPAAPRPVPGPAPAPLDEPFDTPPVLAPQDTVEGPVDLPAGVPLPVDAPLVDESKPHEGCHCEIKTLPSGKKIWRANKNACEDCKAKEQAFNADQNRLYPD